MAHRLPYLKLTETGRAQSASPGPVGKTSPPQRELVQASLLRGRSIGRLTWPRSPQVVAPVRVERTFAFLDLCGFTAYTDAEGDDAAVTVLSTLRALVRDRAAERGVRVTKWLG